MKETKELRKAIQEIVRDNPGIKATKLVVEVVEYSHSHSEDIIMRQFLECDIPELLEDMVKNHEIKEVEYSDHIVEHRNKSLYFSVDCEVKLIV